MNSFGNSVAARDWIKKWRNRVRGDKKSLALMQSANPIYIPRNHRVEEALAAANQDDLQPLYRLLNVLSKPFENHAGHEELMLPPNAEEEIKHTFCGT